MTGHRLPSFIRLARAGAIGSVVAWALSPHLRAADDVLGQIGGHEITVSEVREFLSGLDATQQQTVAGDPALLNQLVRSFFVQKIVLKEALEKKWDQEAAVIAQLARVRESTLTDSYLQSLSKPDPGYPSEAELKEAYEAARPSLLVPRSFRLAQIFVSDPKSSGDKAASAKAQQKVAEVKKKLQTPGADFAVIAQSESEEAQSAARGGEIGWLAETQIQPEIRDRLPGLDLNAISEPLRLDDGWHIIKVLDAREAHTPTLEQVRVRLTEELRAEKLRANTQAYLAKLLEANPIALNELLLGKLAGKERKPTP